VNKYICFVFVLALCPLSVSAECKPGYQSATVVKVLSVSSGPSAPAPADEKEPSPKRNSPATGRLVIFDASGKQYGLRLPPGSNLSVAAGQALCFRQEGKAIRIAIAKAKEWAEPGKWP